MDNKVYKKINWNKIITPPNGGSGLKHLEMMDAMPLNQNMEELYDTSFSNIFL
ncbi:hypothetical protein [Xenorhabdus doucetiae]|uniref:hypothetical protein n=1 Tax=Xenorhabdus doucetiae TaxID=351671 RepID=UPI00142F2DFA|nr:MULTISPECIES: hypothetical protein [Xenorhabdus]